MPAFASTLTPDELEDLVAFLASRRAPGAPPLEEDTGPRLSRP